MIEGQEDVTWPQWQALGAACEEHGVPALLRSDHLLPLAGHEERGVLDAIGTLTALAATTTTLRLGTLVSPATFRHPSILAKAIVTADHVSGGRVELGLGAGWHEREHAAYGLPFAATRQRMDVFAEQLEIVRGLWGPGAFDFAGEHYRLAGVTAQPKPVQNPMPLIVGGSAGPRSARLAARFASEYNTPFPTVDDVRTRRAAVADAWHAEGRDPGTLRFSVMTAAVLGRDAAEVRDRTERVGAKTGEPGFAPPESWIVGTVDEAATQLRALAAAGVDRAMLQLLLHDDLDQVALIGRELADAVRDA
jgi:alkanesulfonate monooxygenase SsuD/methylene tetrahydromethanopterin reductase-like flavin-dependent oxidoreductase (luciferase family)